MKILLVNPPNSGRSIPEEEYGIDSLKPIFRGEPLALEVLAGNLRDHEVMILDLKVEPAGLAATLAAFGPDLVGITGMTCEANAMVALARQVKESCPAKVVVGGIHASNDPDFFHLSVIDYIVIGLGKASFRQLIRALEEGEEGGAIPGICKVGAGKRAHYSPRPFSMADLVDDVPPAYELVQRYRDHYVLTSLQLDMGFVVTAFGCPFRCHFCCIKGLTNGRYLSHSIDTVLRDISLLPDIPVIRLLDANTFAHVEHATRLGAALKEADLRKQFLADVRSDTVVKHPELMVAWREAGLRAVIVGFEEIDDSSLSAMNKASSVAVNSEAIRILHDIGITIIGDFIISPSYKQSDFDRLERYICDHQVDLPMITVLTPLPGTALFADMQADITNHDLDYYTLTNAVTPTRLAEKDFYQRYAALLKMSHSGARL
ncbi:MAG: radical SAM protein [Desulfurivibrionaceae bacterium]|nr:radical SAM protein [Desulfurivibrionaceae bacterium]